jgi:uncharacterized membrane protein
MLLVMQKGYLMEREDAVIAVREASGRIKLNQLYSWSRMTRFQGRCGILRSACCS